VTGGEPTLNSDLPVLLSKIKLLDMSVKLDTNGTNPGMLENLVRKKLVDYIAMDIKAPLEKYSTAAGVFVDREKIAQSVDFLKECGVDYEFRTTVVPALHSREDILAICHWLGHAKRYSLQQFLPAKTLDQRMAAIRPYTPQQMKELAELAGPFFDACEVKNM
jgi:pyruvate formate lyase activating enzyme